MCVFWGLSFLTKKDIFLYDAVLKRGLAIIYVFDLMAIVNDVLFSRRKKRKKKKEKVMYVHVFSLSKKQQFRHSLRVQNHNSHNYRPPIK